MSGFSAAPAFKDAAYDRLVALNAGTAVQVSFGHPGQSQVEDIIAVTEVTSSQDFATMSTNRSREETLELTIVVSVYRGGGVEAEKVCSDRAYELLAAFENYVRATDTTLGGVVRQCFLTSHRSDGATDPQILAAGRLIEVTATFTARARITS